MDNKQKKRTSRFRRNLLLTALGGLLACALLAAASVRLVQSGRLTPLLPYPTVAALMALTLGFFSLAEIPIMVLALRRLLAERADNQVVVLGLNLLYVAFAGVYGAPVILLTGDAGWGIALCALGFVRLGTSLAFIRD